MELKEIELISNQKQICKKYNTEFYGIDLNLKVGISLNVKEGKEPIHGLRHLPEDDTSGWYIWAGEYSSDPNFFAPLHAHHIVDWNPNILFYLGLPPGWRFLIASEYEDVWEDLSLIEIV